ncbi:hypothetical protein ACFQ0D_36250, partial [Micromonospora zhanjiangensis]
GVPGPTHPASPQHGMGFLPDGRPPHVGDVSRPELLWSAGQVARTDFGNDGIVGVRPEGGLVRVDTADGRTTWFRPEVGHGMHNVAETTMRAGTPQDPHVSVVNHRVAGEHLTRAWVREITETVHQQRAEAHRPESQGLIRRAMHRLAALFGHQDAPTHQVDPHQRALMNDRNVLLRQISMATTPEHRAALVRDLAGVDHELAGLGRSAHPFAGAGTPTHGAPPWAAVVNSGPVRQTPTYHG